MIAIFASSRGIVIKLFSIRKDVSNGPRMEDVRNTLGGIVGTVEETVRKVKKR